ncbi:Rcs stress response system protein RcsF [Cronobacter dublinensis]|uniref:Outer membrane lipoprotein RcsF n=1 Tax=Cronobacter dublinensis TaxID=413497 RepID=A0A9Q4XP38_9ENTR|nr:Rcs stress response system protein RcsF [Cronobacter dublinensis]EGT5712803.1 Rcs stress response system protein RcsF [Cronobacter dublinensis subsp. dublinensis]EGT4360097.1 Rcs stress response system protein RcsF [Cronobacter dublinensis]EGT5736058.1 Rcs stress response system protein RcsF [Cronobacter dublinensis subsp. dublinensis]EKF2280299.1 Rcs stress response system protein RcsF [Cronobacter dublinensis]EKF2294437.1 Rcs stress response system protein RcsF [Cronobacter dublinensis]
MRALPICLLAFILSGCSVLSRSPVEPVQSTASPQKSEPVRPKTVRPAPVRIYTNAEDLVGKPFRDLGEVSGESCQATNQDSPPNIPTARKRLQINASKMKANAVLLHSCEVTSGTPGCYRQAVCVGSALSVPTK